MRNMNESNITEEVLNTIEHTQSPRLKTIFTAMIRHLHDFAREVELTPQEWFAAMDFLYRAGQISSPQRNEFILISDVLGVSSLADMLSDRGADGATETSALGPFFVEGAKMLKPGGDLIESNEGEPGVVMGHVCDQKGQPIEGAMLEIWQTAHNGLYENMDPDQREGNLRCRMLSDKDGVYRFTTVKPVSYKVPEDGPGGDMLLSMGRHAWRPAHIHFKLSAEGYRPMATQLYVEDDQYIDEDAVFGVRNSLAVGFKRNDSADEAAKYNLQAPFWVVEYDFRLRPA